MDAPFESSLANPGDETHVRHQKSGETALNNALESKMEPPLVAGQLFGDFRIGELLGRGKAGFVYSADDLLAKGRCALKVLCRMSSHDLYRNKLGFRRMSPFRHPCLMRTDRIDIIEDYTVLSMEEIAGETLYCEVHHLKTLPPAEAYRKLRSLLHDYAVGLAIMHFSGLVHRDVKPTNLMVRTNGQGVIVDYGLVANCDPETDPFGLRPYIAGTPRYFSPEALWEQSYTPAGDVFSLGLVMLDCLTVISGGDPWLRRGEFKDWVREEDEQTIADAVSGLNENIPSLLRMVIAGMLSADRTKRPSSLEIVEMTKTDDNPIRLVNTHHLFGREQELEQCLGWIREIYRGRTGRLHLYGEAGVGKTRLLDEIERQLRQYQWGEVYRVKCRSRETGTLQVLDQIADQLAQRYARPDRDPLRLDPVSASILIQSFPQLRHIIVEDIGATPESFVARPERVDALSAAARLSREVRKVGPMIIIIDDAQWSDHDSDTVWDELQNDSEGLLGIITSSRMPETNQRVAADKRVFLRPLAKEAALSYLQTAAKRWNANINTAGLEELVEMSRGNAFRLQELAEEFRPDGMLHEVEQSSDSSISNLGDIDRFWRMRFDRLSDEAKYILAFIVTADAPVSINQLASLTGFGDHVDVAVSELVQQRLVNDDATGQECITVVHDKVADGLIENLDATEVREAHLRWAELLSLLNRPRDFAARIAGHYYAAGQDGAALPFAIMAAENADRAFVKAEAGQWHERVLEQVAGEAKQKHLRDAARCFYEADLPERASHYFLQLADNATSGQERLQFQTTACQLLVRSGQMDRVRPLLAELTRLFEIGTLPSSGDASGSNRRRLIRLASDLLEHADLTRLMSDEQQTLDRLALTGLSPADDALSFCSQISYSMAVLDCRGTLDLLMHGCQLAVRSGTPEQQIHFGTRACIWAAILVGRQTDVIHPFRQMLLEMLEQLDRTKASNVTAEIHSSLAFIDTLAMDWASAAPAVDACVVDYIADTQIRRFEVSHTRWLRLWSDWHLGQWRSLQRMCHEMVDDAIRRNDTYQQLMTTTGFGGNGFLCSDEVERLQQLCSGNNRHVSDTGEIEFVHFFQWIQIVFRDLYRGQYDRAWSQIVRFRQASDRSLICRVTLVQVVLDFLTAVVGLHVRRRRTFGDDAEAKDAATTPLRPSMIRNAMRRLEDQSDGFPKMIGALLRGIDSGMRGRREQAALKLKLCVELADTLGTTPYALAARDALTQIEDPDAESDSLRKSMLDQGVVNPTALERLYTVRLDRR